MIRNLFVSTLSVLGLVGLIQIAAAQAPMVVGGGCPCPEPCPEKVCRRVPDTKTVTERKYSDTCEDYCRPKCPCFFGLFGGGCGDCGTVHTKKYLVIHFPKHEECVTKCVVETVQPACQPTCPSPCYGPAPFPPAPVTPPPAPKVGMMMPTGPAQMQAQQWPH